MLKCTLFLLTFICIQCGSSPLRTDDPFTYGNPDAPIHIIVMEEFACSFCKTLCTEVLPTIEKNYVEKGLVKITLIPLAFLDESLPACTLALCTQKIAPDHLKSFYPFLFLEDPLTLYKQTHPDFPSDEIQSHLNDDFSDIIEHNLNLARSIYPNDIHVPIVLLNGKLIQDADLNTLPQEIDRFLSKF